MLNIIFISIVINLLIQLINQRKHKHGETVTHVDTKENYYNITYYKKQDVYKYVNASLRI